MSEVVQHYVSWQAVNGKAPSEIEINIMLNLLDKKANWDNILLRFMIEEKYCWNYVLNSDDLEFTITRTYRR